MYVKNASTHTHTKYTIIHSFSNSLTLPLTLVIKHTWLLSAYYLLSAYFLPILEHGLLSACAKQMWSRSSCHIHTFTPSLTPERKEIMAAASGLQRTLDIRMFNQAKGSRMSYTREYKLEVVISVPRDKSVLNCQMILSQHEDDRMLGS